MKSYKNTKELIDIIQNKGIAIDDSDYVKEKIEKYGFYNVINTYREPFRRNGSYLPNVNFNEIFALFEFDLNIKSLLLKYTLEIEIIIKNRLSDCLGNNYGLEDYLNIDNFNRNNKTDILIIELINKINDEIKYSSSKHDAISHYLNNYGYIPPYVLVKILSIGTLSKYYQLMKQDDQQEISKYFKITDKDLKSLLKNLTFIRNICAHSDRLYCYRNIITLGKQLLPTTYKFRKNINDLYTVILAMEKILPKEKYDILISEFNNELNNLEKQLKSISIDRIKGIIGVQ